MDPANASTTQRVSAPALRVSDITGQLLLPKIFRAGTVAARPERVIAGFVSLLLILLAAALLNGPPPTPESPDLAGPLVAAVRTGELASAGLVEAITTLDFPNLADRARIIFLEAPTVALEAAPVRTVAFALIVAAVWGLCGLFIARGAGMEFGRNIHLRPGRCFRFVKTKGPAAVVALLMPFILVGLFLLVPFVLGLMMMVPGLNAVAGAIYGLGLIASAIASAVLLVWLAASWMMLPAVACDGADAFDATQRAFGMFLSKPLGVLIHLAVAAALGVVLVGIASIVADLAVAFAGLTAGSASQASRDIVIGAAAQGPSGAASLFVGVWARVPGVLVASYAISYVHTASTAVYLNARKMVDGQEHSELWMPGDAAGVVQISAKPAADPESSAPQE